MCNSFNKVQEFLVKLFAVHVEIRTELYQAWAAGTGGEEENAVVLRPEAVVPVSKVDVATMSHRAGAVAVDMSPLHLAIKEGMHTNELSHTHHHLVAGQQWT